ncbi:anthranilate synthase component I family protein [Psychroflexus montanilacus]|uniref:anthranilate synthase component I family protein n=1 Tax=Psychroflexus montanilacus TaxID=2873598 RepID=UPI001CC93ECE|nr:anthranilate synthase component I family protein [Psychroflexus montanilacus]MBZ9653029.1 anthranilate synthase component I family protein [Psychroflexus montanilacus]
MRTIKTFQNTSTQENFKQKLLQWGNQFEEVVFLDSNQTEHLYQEYEAILAVDGFTAIKSDDDLAFEKLDEFQTTTKDWLFGYLSYDLKNDTESISSNNKDQLQFPELYFIQPKKIWLFKDDIIEAHYLTLVDDEIDNDFESILATELSARNEDITQTFTFSPRWQKEEYVYRAKQILAHIQRGDIYEVNFCQEFYIDQINFSPLPTFNHLNSISKAPFSSFLKFEHYHALCASPERFLKKQGQKLISQPIKGTARRGQDKTEDEQLKFNLKNDPKEISENIMIVDLVRNDLSKTAIKSSVAVEELCEIYSYKQVHQLVSTLTSEVKTDYSVAEVLKSLFPMGSMTGAPKRSAMEIAETYETTKRGLYSGAIGYITPNNDFDFNVVIRSLLYNSEKKYLSYMVGSALTSMANPEQEYEECLLKGKALQYVVNATRVTEK